MAAPPRVAAVAAIRARRRGSRPALLRRRRPPRRGRTRGQPRGSRGPGLPLALRSNLAVVSSVRAETAYVEGGILHWGGRVLVTGRLVDVRAPRFDAARVPKASPAVAMGTPRSRAAGLVAFAPQVDAASVASLVGRGEGLTPLGDDVICGWLAAHRGAGTPTPEVDDAVRRLLPRTTTLSASLLVCALAGEVADPGPGYLRSLGTTGADGARARLECVRARSSGPRPGPRDRPRPRHPHRRAGRMSTPRNRSQSSRFREDPA